MYTEDCRAKKSCWCLCFCAKYSIYTVRWVCETKRNFDCSDARWTVELYLGNYRWHFDKIKCRTSIVDTVFSLSLGSFGIVIVFRFLWLSISGIVVTHPNIFINACVSEKRTENIERNMFNFNQLEFGRFQNNHKKWRTLHKSLRNVKQTLTHTHKFSERRERDASTETRISNDTQ